MKRSQIRILLILLTVFATGIGCVVALYRLSDYVIHRRGSFMRVYPPSPIVKVQGLDIDIDNHYVAGVTNSEIYLVTKDKAFDVLKVTTAQMDTSCIMLQLSEFSSIKSYGLDVQIDSPFFYVTDGAIPFIYKGTVANWSATRVPFDSAYFLDIIPVNGRDFVTRSYSNRVGRALLTRISTKEPKLTLHPEILEKQVDGLFCTDGMLHYNKSSNLLVYLYYYRNQFIVMDSLLNIRYRGNTIDTFRIAQVEITSLSRSNHTSRRLSGPPPYVNKNSAASARKLFVHSMVAAKNEDLNQFKDASVIDVYDLSNGEYEFSFYIYHRDGEKIKSFHVTDYHLYAIYDHYIAKYTLHPSRFKPSDHKEILSIKSGM